MHFNRCIPYRWTKDNTDQMGETREIIEVLMVSSPKRDDLVFPKVFHIVCTNNWWTSLMKHFILKRFTFFSCKGGWEDDETVTEAACREALEEAGVKGILRVGSISL